MNSIYCISVYIKGVVSALVGKEKATIHVTWCYSRVYMIIIYNRLIGRVNPSSMKAQNTDSA